MNKTGLNDNMVTSLSIILSGIYGTFLLFQLSLITKSHTNLVFYLIIGREKKLEN